MNSILFGSRVLCVVSALICFILSASAKPGAAGENILVDDHAGQAAAHGDPKTDVNVSFSIEDVMDALNGQSDAVLDEAEYYYSYARNNEMLGNFYDAGKVALAMVEQHRRMGFKPIDYATLFQHTDISSCGYRPNIVAYGNKHAWACISTTSEPDLTEKEIECVCKATGQKLADSFLKDPRTQIQVVDRLFQNALEASIREYRADRELRQKR